MVGISTKEFQQVSNINFGSGHGDFDGDYLVGGIGSDRNWHLNSVLRYDVGLSQTQIQDRFSGEFELLNYCFKKND